MVRGDAKIAPLENMVIQTDYRPHFVLDIALLLSIRLLARRYARSAMQELTAPLPATPQLSAAGAVRLVDFRLMLPLSARFAPRVTIKRQSAPRVAARVLEATTSLLLGL